MGAVARATPAGGIVDAQVRQAIEKKKYQDLLAHPPPPAPDLTDAAVRAAAIQGMGAIGQGRKSTFLSGGSGFGAPTTKRKSLLGGM